MWGILYNLGPATRIRFRTPEQMKAKANTTSEQSNEKSMEVGRPSHGGNGGEGKKMFINVKYKAMFV